MDLDADGVDDGAGPLALGISHFFRFETEGPHRIRVDLEKAGESFDASRTVHVSDPGMLEYLGFSSTTRGFIGGGLTGLALSPDEDTLYVSSHYGVAALRTNDSTVLWSVVLYSGTGFDGRSTTP